MRILLSGAAVAALAVGSMSVAVAMPNAMSGGTMMPHCTATSGPVVWWMAAMKTYYLKGSSHFGMGKGMYACRATAVAAGGHPGRGMMGGSHGTMGGSHAMPGSSMPGSSMPGSSMPGSSMPGSSMPATMAPRPMTSPGGMMTSPMPRATSGPGLPNSTNAAPGSQGSPMPMTSGSPISGGQGNTGAPGAGGQVPNNPASSSNSNPNPNPNPSPSPRP